MPNKIAHRLVSARPLLCTGAGAHATEGALGPPRDRYQRHAQAGIVSPEPILAVNIGEIYLDGSVSGSRSVPIAGKASLGIDGNRDEGLGHRPGRVELRLQLHAAVRLDHGHDQRQRRPLCRQLAGHRVEPVFDIYFTPEQLGDDSGPLADRLNGFRGHDWAVGPIVTYDTRIGARSVLSLSLRWVPTVASKNRLKSTNTFMGTATIVF